jgi:mannosyl-glycoprotein endo-beta-N-acetylglucosaminidase
LKTIKNKGKNPRRVYIGSDCFGRNTYEGGMYHTYKAVNKVWEYKDDLSVALFAPGFTYEDGG